MSNGHHEIPVGCRNPALWLQAKELIEEHEEQGAAGCSCGRIEPCSVRFYAQRAVIKAMTNYSRAVGIARVSTRIEHLVQ